MKILFVEKNLREIDKLGPLYIARMLVDAGHEVDMVQTDIENIDDYLHDLDWAMFSIITGEQGYVRFMTEKLKGVNPDIKICVGGPHVTFDATYPAREPNVDFFIRGPGELIINDIVNGRIKDRVILAPYPDIDELSPPYRDIIYKYPALGKAKMKRFITVRGCPNSCTYCFNKSLREIYHNDRDKILKRRKPSLVIEEILDVWDKFGLGYVYFNDDNFSINTKWLRAFCQLYKDQVGLPFGTGMRPDTVSPWILKMLVESGMVFTNYALETQDSKLQEELLNRGTRYRDSIMDAVKWTKDYGIKVRVLNMIGLPIANPLEEALATLEFNKKLNPTDSWAAIYQPEPSTKLYDYCVENGYYTPHDYWDDVQTFYKESSLNIRDKAKVERLQTWWFYLVRHNIDLDFVKRLLEVPLTEEMENVLTTERRLIAKRELYLME